LEFLQALDGSSLAAGANIAIIGSDDIEPDYAARCRALVAASPELSRCVHFLGELPYAQTIDYMARSELFVSTSPFESYGMAIAEARALGLPVVARQGGNVKHLVSRDTGGQLCDSARALADSFIALTHDRDALRSRAERAIASRLPARNWSHVADEFTAAST
jgi:glycosyltransferase involved in cell wall biosynthesis